MSIVSLIKTLSRHYLDAASSTIVHFSQALDVNTVVIDCSAWLLARFGHVILDGPLWRSALDRIAEQLIAECKSDRLMPVRLVLCFDAPEPLNHADASYTTSIAERDTRLRLLSRALLGGVVPRDRTLQELLGHKEWHAAFNVALFGRIVQTAVSRLNPTTTVFIDGLLPSERRVAICVLHRKSLSSFPTTTTITVNSISTPSRVVVCDASRSDITGVALLQWPARTRFAVDRAAVWAAIAPGTAVVYSNNQMALAKLMMQQELGVPGRSVQLADTKKTLFSECMPCHIEREFVDVRSATILVQKAYAALLDGITVCDNAMLYVMPVVALLMHEFSGLPYSLETVIAMAAGVAQTFCAEMITVHSSGVELAVDQYMRLCVHIAHSTNTPANSNSVMERHAIATAMLNRLYDAYI